MTRPLFSVGEEVILCSAYRPECNGEYIVMEILEVGEKFTCRLTGKSIYIFSGGVVYLLNVPIKSLRTDGREGYIAQSALRKKYPPSTDSFKEIMTKMLSKKGSVKI